MDQGLVFDKFLGIKETKELIIEKIKMFEKIRSLIFKFDPETAI